MNPKNSVKDGTKNFKIENEKNCEGVNFVTWHSNVKEDSKNPFSEHKWLND